jgi:hypothetical protein
LSKPVTHTTPPTAIVRALPPGITPVVFTATGTLEFEADPFPSCPFVFAPQQYTFLSDAIKQLEPLFPAEIVVTVLPARTPEVLTATGTFEREVPPFPNRPFVPEPQQYALSSEAIAQVVFHPAEMDFIVLPDSTPEVLIAIGTFELVLEPLPRFPVGPYPQQYTFSSYERAHVLLVPVPIADAKRTWQSPAVTAF